jgi:integrase
MVQRVQRGHVYAVKDARGRVISFHVRYRVPELKDGQPVRVLKSQKLVSAVSPDGKKDERYWLSKDGTPCKALQDLCDEFMRQVNPSNRVEDMPVVDFWEKHYFPFIRENKKRSTVTGYHQIWEQHLKVHFAGKTLREYRTHMGSQFLLSLTKKQGQRTLAHIRSLASAVFTYAVNMGWLELNPWHDVKILGKIKPPKPTPHYTLEEAEDIISALVEHVDCQLVMALACFMGLRPGEIAGLKWEDFDEDSVHIRRAVVRGVVGTTKTPESVATLPLVEQVKVPLEQWRMKCGNAKEGWLFQTKTGNPIDLRDWVDRKIRPTLKAKKIEWKSLYAGRRGAGTALIGLTNGNYAAAQELLRHKNMSTTLQFYKKQTKQALSDGMKAMEAALKPKALAAAADAGKEE